MHHCHTLQLSPLTYPYFPATRKHTHVHSRTPTCKHLPRCPSPESSIGPVLETTRKYNIWETQDRSSKTALIANREIKRLITIKDSFKAKVTQLWSLMFVKLTAERDRERGLLYLTMFWIPVIIHDVACRWMKSEYGTLTERDRHEENCSTRRKRARMLNPTRSGKLWNRTSALAGQRLTSEPNNSAYNVFSKLTTVPKICVLWFYGRNFIVYWSQHVSAAHVAIFKVMTQEYKYS